MHHKDLKATTKFSLKRIPPFRVTLGLLLIMANSGKLFHCNKKDSYQEHLSLFAMHIVSFEIMFHDYNVRKKGITLLLTCYYKVFTHQSFNTNFFSHLSSLKLASLPVSFFLFAKSLF